MLTSVLERHQKWLVKLCRQVWELRANPLEKRMLALDIQEQLLYRIGRAERVIRQKRKNIGSIERALAQPGKSKSVARKAKARRLAGIDRIDQLRT